MPWAAGRTTGSSTSRAPQSQSAVRSPPSPATTWGQQRSVGKSAGVTTRWRTDDPAFHRRHGWTRATHPSPGGKGIVVLLGPHHPARSLAPLPL
ncbi:hypothetical protein DJ64_21120 [Streptomyces griseorubens]|uniref:Transposase n=1 Tax=Streptomyces griseorubens TaxID=66897 RepID=A0ABR4STU7_9ACTN|nr:hypothetical protein DJ64_21120 [Streptomyces griseorubens]